jgi:RNA polymerase sigma factor (sigma-70 family)
MSPPPPGPDAAWRDGLRRLEPAALDAVYRAHAGDVLACLRRGFAYEAGGVRRFARVESAFDAEEVCQEAFAAFFAQVRDGRFDVERPARPYLLRIAANLALRRLGRAGREVPMIDLPEPAAPARGPEDAERARLLAEFRGGLSPLDQSLLTDWFDDDVTQEAVGAKHGLSRDQVYRAVARIRAAALRFFGARGWFDDPR